MSIKRWTAYVGDDDGDDVFVCVTPDARGEWIRYSDHEAEVERLAAERDRETRGARAVHNLALAILERHQNGTAADRRDLKSILELTLAAVSAEKAP